MNPCEPPFAIFLLHKSLINPKLIWSFFFLFLRSQSTCILFHPTLIVSVVQFFSS